MKLQWSAPARRDIRELSDYYSRIDPDLAERMEHAIEAEPPLLLEYPRMGRNTLVRGIRKWRVGGTPYQLYYRIGPESIVIIRVLHVARDVFW